MTGKAGTGRRDDVEWEGVMLLWEAGLKAEEIADIVGLSVQHVRKRSAAHRKLPDDVRAQLRAEAFARIYKRMESDTLRGDFAAAKTRSDALARLAKSQQIVEREMAKSGQELQTALIEEMKSDGGSAADLSEDDIEALRERLKARLLRQQEQFGADSHPARLEP